MKSAKMNAHKLKSTDGLVLHLHSAVCDNPKADLVFIHGFFEHSGRYGDLAAYFNADNYNFYSYDQRSHGLSGGPYRSYVSSFENYISDLRTVLAHFNIGADRPFYLVSHSMGGLVLVSHLLEKKEVSPLFKGAIFSAPLILPDKDMAPLLQKLSGLIGTLFPKLKTIKLDSSHISRDPQEIKKYESDPLNYTDKMYAASGYQLLKQMRLIQPQLKQFDYPFLVLHGTDDKLAEVEGSKLLYKSAASRDKEFVPLEHFKHEILKEIDKEIVHSKIKTWMNARL